MNIVSDSSKPSESNKKRSASPQEETDSPISKHAKVHLEKDEQISSSEETTTHADRLKNNAGAAQNNRVQVISESAKSYDKLSCSVADGDSVGRAAMAAAEVLASLTGSRDHDTETPCSSKQVFGEKVSDQLNSTESTRAGQPDSSSCAPKSGDEWGQVEEVEDEEDEDDSLRGSSFTASSSDEEYDEEEEGHVREDGECAIVSVQMAPELRRSVAMLAHVQMRLDALEKRGARLHRRLELKLGRQRRPHLDQRASLAQSIPGFWLTALLNHPHLSTYIDESDEDALSYMSNLEIETFKNNKFGYRICFHFRRNPFFQNKVIVKELHLGMGGSPVSFSNSILWHQGASFTGNSEPQRNSQGVYQSFFHWFSDHSDPGKDEVAQILKDDLYKNPLRYYLTPLWEPRENGSIPKAPQNSNGDECVIISDSDDDQEPVSQDPQQELEKQDDDDDDDEDRGQAIGSENSDREAVECSFVEREDDDVNSEEEDESHDSGGDDVEGQGQKEEDGGDANKEEVEGEN